MNINKKKRFAKKPDSGLAKPSESEVQTSYKASIISTKDAPAKKEILTRAKSKNKYA